MDRINEVWCSDAFAPKFVLRKVSSVIQGHNYWSYDGVTINRLCLRCIWTGNIPISELPCTVPIRKSRGMAQYVSVAQIRSDVFFIMLHHTSKFEITILFHTSSAKGIVKRRLLIISGEQEYGQDMCKVTDTSSYIHSLRHHRVIKDIGKV